MTLRDPTTLLSAAMVLPLMAGWFRGRGAAAKKPASQVLAEAALSEAEARYRSVFDATTDGLLVLDERGIVQEANPAAVRMIGFPSAKLAGVDIRTLIPADQFGIYDLEHFTFCRSKT